MDRQVALGAVLKISLGCTVSALFLAGCASSQSTEPRVIPPAPTVAIADHSTRPMQQVPLSAPPVTMQPDAPLEYVVKPGDTLWGIASRYLTNPWQWPEIWTVNNQIENPHLIYPGDVLHLTMVDGRPQLTRLSGGKTVKLSPHTRETLLASAVPTIPIEAIRDFLNGPRLVSEDTLDNAAYVLSFAGGNLVAGTGTELYARGFDDKNTTPNKGDRYLVVHKGDPYSDPETGRLLGYEAIPTAEIEIESQDEDPVTANIVRSFRETQEGDRLLPVDPDVLAQDFYPHAPKQSIGGQIVAVYDGLSQIGQYHIVALNRGSENGLEPGHVLRILRRGGSIEDKFARKGPKAVELPDRYAGELLIFQTDPHVSFGLVMSVVMPAHIGDKVESPLFTDLAPPAS